ncbi:MAG: TIGR04086 family membrane protein [Hydrogenibacillus schlegelii]|nr:TIGR04086 family membrane protein [Hydrogenibacillus schlegelii]
MERSLLSTYARALGVMAAIVVAGTIALTALIAFGPFSERHALPVVYGLHLVALVVGGWIVGAAAGRRGWMHGFVLGLLYALGLGIIGFLAYDTLPGSKGLVFAGLGLFFATAGGMIGVARRP